MQKVVGSNPISRFENPRICGGFLVTGPSDKQAAAGRGNRLKARGVSRQRTLDTQPSAG